MNLDDNGNKTYRVLSMNGNVAKLLGMNDISTSQVFNTITNQGTFTNGNTGQLYADSALDIYLNTTWYDTLSTSTKAAIISEYRIQYAYISQTTSQITDTTTYQVENDSSGDYKGANLVDNIAIGDRNIFALDVKDIFDYFDKNKITSNELMGMWTNQTSAINGGWWLSSARINSPSTAWLVLGTQKSLTPNMYNISYRVRPAFNIDLSKIPFTKTTEVNS